MQPLSIPARVCHPLLPAIYEITSNDWLNPQYSYPLTDEMVEGFTFSKPSLVKCQIITGNIERDVQRRLGSIKERYFNEIVDKIVDSIF